MTDRVSPEEVRQMLQQLVEQIERGGMESVTIKVMTDEGEEEQTISTKTEEERASALAALRIALRQLH